MTNRLVVSPNLSLIRIGYELQHVPVDLRVPGGPAPLLGNTNNNIPTAVAFLATRNSTLPAGFTYQWCGDSGCTRTTSDQRSDFITFEQKRIPIMVVKQGAILEGQGVGDILIHTRDNLGYPVTIRQRDCI